MKPSITKLTNLKQKLRNLSQKQKRVFVKKCRQVSSIAWSTLVTKTNRNK